ncbi:MAG: MBL fold metallo-hydrolase [Armatimonadetes bacterium]|nr:MBL fold metallo-hydrolase [Armatimonadota bacterium]
MKITTLDTGFGGERTTAAYLVESADGLVLCDTGAGPKAPDRILVGLDARDIVGIVLTHIHLDHAGCAGELMRRCPNATLYVHPRGARHMVDPSKLIAGAREVWGALRFDALYGEILPVEASRVREVAFGAGAGAFGLDFYDAPGHAKHHLVAHDSESRSVIAGDAFGLAYSEFEFSFPTTSPVQFDPAAMTSTYEMIASLKPSQVFVGHFGAVLDVAERSESLIDLVLRIVAMAVNHHADADCEQAIAESLKDLVRELNSAAVERYKVDCEINAQGIVHWLNSQAG